MVGVEGGLSEPEKKDNKVEDGITKREGGRRIGLFHSIISYVI